MDRFRRTPSRTGEAWILDHMKQGWLVREHGGARKRFFNPKGSKTPVPCDSLSVGRWTVIITPDEVRHIADDWTISSRKWHQTWRGYTLFRIKGENVSDPWDPALTGESVLSGEHVHESRAVPGPDGALQGSAQQMPIEPRPRPCETEVSPATRAWLGAAFLARELQPPVHAPCTLTPTTWGFARSLMSPVPRLAV